MYLLHSAGSGSKKEGSANYLIPIGKNTFQADCASLGVNLRVHQILIVMLCVNKMSKQSFQRSIFEYQHYRPYLRDYAMSKRASTYGFSYRQFARRAGINSPNYFQKIINEEKRLSPTTGEKFVKGLGLLGEQATYFRLLIQADRGPSEKVRAEARYNVRRLQMKHIIIPNDRTIEPRFTNHFCLPIIAELATCKNFKLTAENLVKVVNFHLTVSEAQTLINQVVQLGHIKENTGEYLIAQKKFVALSNVSNFKSVRSRYISDYSKLHDNLVCQEHPQVLSSGLVIAVSPKKYQLLINKMNEFLEIIHDDLAYDEEATDVIRVHLAAFPVAEPNKELTIEGRH